MNYSFIDIAENLKITSYITPIQKIIFPDGCNITVNFCSKEYIISINKKSLNHNYSTDIITFYYDKEQPHKEAELLISPDVVKENAKLYGTSFEQEINRVIAHGMLHLKGYNDSNPEEQKQMRAAEEQVLEQLFPVEQ